MKNLVNRVEKKQNEGKQLENSHEIKIFEGKYLKTFLVVDSMSKKPNKLIIRDSESQEYISNTQPEMTINFITPKKNIFTNFPNPASSTKLPSIDKTEKSNLNLPKYIPAKFKIQLDLDKTKKKFEDFHGRNLCSNKLLGQNFKFKKTLFSTSESIKNPPSLGSSNYIPLSTDETSRFDKINLPTVRKTINVTRLKKVKQKLLKVDHIKILHLLEKKFGVQTIEE
jgi:hypothetical protein